MTLHCSVSSAAPATTNIVMGFYGQNNFYLDLATATPENVAVVNDFIDVIGKHAAVEIVDYTGETEAEINVIIPDAADSEQLSLTYPALSNTAKGKVTAFLNLIESLLAV